MSWKELSENVFLLTGSPNTMVIIHKEEAYVIDPGHGEGRAKTIHRKLDTVGVEKRSALLTHGHIDHIAECKNFQKTFAHRWEIGIAESATLRNVLEFGINATKGFRFITGDSVTITDTVEWGEKIGQITAMGTPGHTPGHTIYIHKDIVYAGDALFGDRLVEKVKILYTMDVESFLKSLEVLERLARNGKRIIPSHGPVVEGEKALELIDKNKEAFERLKSDLWNILEEPGTLEEVTIRLMEYYGLRTDPEFVLLDMVPVRSIISKWHEDGRVSVEATGRGLLWKKM